MVSRCQRNDSPTFVNFSFLDRSHYFLEIAPQLSSRGWVDPVPDPLLLRKSGSAENQTRNLWIYSQELWPLDHRCGMFTYEIIMQEIYFYVDIYILWHITPCSLWKANQQFGGTCRLHLQGRRINQARNQHEAGTKHRHFLLIDLRWFLTWRTLQPWRCRRELPPKCRLTFNGLHGVISQKREKLRNDGY
jgi:hypothetical protein